QRKHSTCIVESFAMRKPLVSVVLPTFNRASTLPDAVRSVLMQTYNRLELIVVDDGSRDATPQVMQEFLKADSRVRYIRYVENRGVSHARNVGLDQARGELVAFQDSDDLWFPDKLEKQVETFLKEGGHVGVWGYWEVAYDRGTVHRFPRTPPRVQDPLHVSLLYRGLGVCPQVLLVPAEYVQHIRFNETLPYVVDVDFALRLSRSGLDFVFVPEVLVQVRRRVHSVHLTSRINPEVLLAWAHRNRELLPEERDYTGFLVWYVAPAALQMRWRRRVLRWVVQGLVHRVLSFRDALWFVRQVVVLPERVG
ncbi:MAG: glycosyltransferase family 2 protein, partial [Candidatus Hydrothermae bacterium]|nr:glycosyltransferase family 2 protein [Candidatus Hydrothermae bacterium]